MIKSLIILLLASLVLTTQAQEKLSLNSISFDQEGPSIQAIQLYSDSNSTSFVIFISDKVKAHFHKYHTETIVVLEGNAEMQLNHEYFEINVSDILTIPPKSTHFVKVTSKKPLKVLSIQAPEFIGTDRYFINE